ncbi:hypothetical protein [Streptomyces naphthomycinicus]|uniref:hypothetical protein n=1 Tax=Streptomyces naphthomycinicus TaxID=2872625 RepID=UPI001CED40BD|nr:hypothetical protein [Streptomyces sp. TML10]
MSETVYGLLGALGGSLITAAAAYWGPLRLSAAARKEAGRAEGRARREAETTRIILMRTTTRTWRDLLARTIEDLELGLLVEITAFDEAVTTARDSAQSALDHALHDGIWIQQTGYGYPAAPSGPFGPDQLRVLTALGHLTNLTRVAVIRGEPLDTDRAAALRRALDTADEARGELSAALLNRLEQIMGVTVIGGQASAPAAP